MFSYRAEQLFCVRFQLTGWIIASPNKKDMVFMHVKGPGLHFYAPTGNGGKKYMCAPEAKCKSHQRYFQKDTTSALYKHFLHQYPLRRGV